jgi:hypothetical protein
MSNVVAFLESDRQKWLKHHLAAVAGHDTESASRYLVQEAFIRLARLRRAGTVDVVLREDFQRVRRACDKELISRARANGSTKMGAWVPLEELALEGTNTAAVGWPCSGQIGLVSFTLPHVELKPFASRRGSQQA